MQFSWKVLHVLNPYLHTLLMSCALVELRDSTRDCHIAQYQGSAVAQWLSAWLETERPLVRASPASLRCGSWARHIYPSLVLNQSRKIRPCLTGRLLMGRKQSNQTNKYCPIWHWPLTNWPFNWATVKNNLETCMILHSPLCLVVDIGQFGLFCSQNWPLTLLMTLTLIRGAISEGYLYAY